MNLIKKEKSFPGPKPTKAPPSSKVQPTTKENQNKMAPGPHQLVIGNWLASRFPIQVDANQGPRVPRLIFCVAFGGWVLFGIENIEGASNKSGSSQWACQLKYFRGLSEGTPDHESYWKRKIFSRAPSQSKPLPHQRSSPHPKRIKKDGPWSPSTCNRELTGQSVPYSSWCKPGANGG